MFQYHSIEILMFLRDMEVQSLENKASSASSAWQDSLS